VERLIQVFGLLLLVVLPAIVIFLAMYGIDRIQKKLERDNKSKNSTSSVSGKGVSTTPTNNNTGNNSKSSELRTQLVNNKIETIRKGISTDGKEK
jgi:cytoskeletal protein RodZ